MCRLDNWINEGSGWIIDLVNIRCLNVSTYVPLLGSSFIELPEELNSSMRGLINVRNSDNKCFLWCHVRHLNPVSNNSTRIADTLDYSSVNFLVSAKDYGKLEDQNDICINVFSYEGKIVCPMYVSEKEFNDCMNVLMMHEGDRSHYVYIKDFNRLMFNKTKSNNKNWFCMRCLQCFSSESILERHKENFLVINGEQRVKLKKRFISFKNYSKKMRVPFKIYADFECIFKKSKRSGEALDENSSWSVKMEDHVPCGFRYKVVCIDDEFTKDVVVYRGKECAEKFIEAILREFEYCKSVVKDHFNKSLIMSMEEEEVFHLANKCWICGKLFDSMDER